MLIKVWLMYYSAHKSDRVQFAPKCCINIFWRYIFLCSVPPTISVLLDEKGSEVETSVGPYNVGGTLILTCDILGGENIKICIELNYRLQVTYNLGHQLISLICNFRFRLWFLTTWPSYVQLVTRCSIHEMHLAKYLLFNWSGVICPLKE